VKTDQRFVHGNSMGYDAVTSSLLIPQIGVATGPIFVIDADNGSTTSRVLSLGGLPFGPLGCFAIGADEGGSIYGYNDAPNRFMALWEGLEDESPTSVPLQESLLARNYDIHGGGDIPTTIYTAGSADAGPIEVCTRGPGGVPTLREKFGGGTSSPGGKAGVAAGSGYPASVVYGCDGVNPGSNGIHIWRRIDGQMTYGGELPIPGGFGGAPVFALACEPENDGLIFALIGNGRPSCVMAINAKTYQMEGIYYIPKADAVGEHGSLIANRKKQLLFWYGRPKSSTLASPLGHWGCLRYTVPPVRPMPTSTPTPTPSPTPWLNPDVEIRALWVTRYDYKTTDAVRLIIKNAADCHFNIVLLQVRANAMTCYPSALEPWAWELSEGGVENTGRDPGWDPLAVAIQEAHAAGLQLHAYMVTYPGWKQTIPPPLDVPHVWNTHRDWFCCDKDGVIMWPHGWWDYWVTFLSPGHPEVRAYLHEVYMEVLHLYPNLDGIHYDYIRYPSEVGDYSWNPVDVSLFTAWSGGTPDEKPSEWAQWKRDQITALVRENYIKGEKIRRGTMFSGAVISSYSSERDTFFQDSHAWLAEGIIDCIMPMLYTTDMVYFEEKV
jgi:uncharacterized lipoprotein YddW (UPF0748 family)